MRRFLIAALSSLSLACAGPRATWQGSSLVGKPAALAVPRLDGREQIVPSPRAQATVVDFWASWCDPCRDLLPLLDRVSKQYRDRGVEVYAVAFDEDRAAVEAFLARTPVGFPILWDKGGALLAVKMEITRLPTTILLDRDGTVRAVHLGYEKGDGADLERELEEVLARPDQ
jgi:thiol-disulfide isomerase/thioredoxin